MLKNFVRAIRPLYEVLSGARSDLLTTIRESCRRENVDPTVRLISEVVNEDATYQKTPLDLRNQRTYAVKVIRCHTDLNYTDIITVWSQWPFGRCTSDL
jgi:DNA mismatch repair protein MSH4